MRNALKFLLLVLIASGLATPSLATPTSDKTIEDAKAVAKNFVQACMGYPSCAASGEKLVTWAGMYVVSKYGVVLADECFKTPTCLKIILAAVASGGTIVTTGLSWHTPIDAVSRDARDNND